VFHETESMNSFSFRNFFNLQAKWVTFGNDSKIFGKSCRLQCLERSDSYTFLVVALVETCIQIIMGWKFIKTGWRLGWCVVSGTLRRRMLEARQWR